VSEGREWKAKERGRRREAMEVNRKERKSPGRILYRIRKAENQDFMDRH
jgi:hypothetical protein